MCCPRALGCCLRSHLWAPEKFGFHSGWDRCPWPGGTDPLLGGVTQREGLSRSPLGTQMQVEMGSRGKHLCDRD